MGNSLRWFYHFGTVFLENILKRHFQNEDGIILLHGAPVQSKFDGFKASGCRCSWSSVFETRQTKLLGNPSANHNHFWNTLFGEILKSPTWNIVKTTLAEWPWIFIHRLLEILNMGSISSRKHKLEIIHTNLASWDLGILRRWNLSTWTLGNF